MNESFAPSDSAAADRFRHLAVRHLEGSLTVEEFSHFDHLLAENATCRSELITFALQARLIASHLVAMPELAPQTSTMPPAGTPLFPSPRRRFALSSLTWSILAASLLFAAYFIGISWNMLGKQQASPHRPTVPSSHRLEHVATIRDKSDVQWSPNSRLTDSSTSRGEPITANQPLSIQSGLVELELKQGTTLLIEGPADWKINGDNSATLTHGKLVAKVPQQAIGFTLETPTAKIVDLGTEFGVEVDPVRGAHVRVLKGEIDVRPARIAGSTTKSVRLNANQAIRISSDGHVEYIEPDELKFAIDRDPTGRPRASDSRYEVVLYYRMGEDDPAEASDDGNAGVLTTQPHPSASVQRPLKLMPSAFHSDEAAPNVSQRSIRFDRRGATPQWETLGVPADIDSWLLEAWVRVEEISNVQLAHIGDGKMGYGLVLWDGKFQGVFEEKSWFSPTSKPELGRWTHLALLHEMGGTQLFVNGAPEGDTLKIDPPSHGGQFAIGAGESFRGAIDEVRLVKLKRAFRPDMLLWKATNPVPKPLE